jgi:hypothetical protein
MFIQSLVELFAVALVFLIIVAACWLLGILIRFLIPPLWRLLERIDSDFSSFADSSWESASIDALIGLCAGSFATPPLARPWLEEVPIARCSAQSLIKSNRPNSISEP